MVPKMAIFLLIANATQQSRQCVSSVKVCAPFPSSIIVKDSPYWKNKCATVGHTAL